MRAVLRLGLVIAAAGLALGQAPALAQSAPEASTNTPAADSIGPRELQNFNLQGTVTRPSEAAPAPNAPPAARAQQARPTPRAADTAVSAVDSPPRQRSAAASERPARPTATAPAAPSVRTAESRRQAPSLSSITVDLPPARPGHATGANAVPASAPAFADDEPAAELRQDQGLPVWPWLLAAVALGAGAAFMFRRRTAREAFAGPQVDSFVAPERPATPRTRAPAPPPPPAPAPPPPQPAGIVSTRIRPWLDISFEPLRCVVEGERVVFEFELGLFNSGSAPVRDLLIEASMFNAGPTQDQDIGAFFEKPHGQGERIPELPPRKRVNLRPHVAVAREHIRVLEAGGRRVFVPLIAFNALYRWGRGEGQTSAAYLLGRETKSEKLAPFRLDLGPRIFRGLGARALPLSVRR